MSMSPVSPAPDPCPRQTGAGTPYVLGLDIGANSVGWAVVDLEGGEPHRLRAAGVRIFEAGVEGSIESGKDTPRGQARREARQQRRQTDRRARRLAHLYRVLANQNLLPPPETGWTAAARHDSLQSLDRKLAQRHCTGNAVTLPSRAPVAAPFQVLPYILRARALDDRLDPHELGRALYHLGQRRGYRSNRRTDAPLKKELGAVESGIHKLDLLMQERKARTLGELFATLDPTRCRIRQRYTARRMYIDEFERIVAAQAVHHPAILDAKCVSRIRRAIFYQRPLKSQRHLANVCELESREVEIVTRKGFRKRIRRGLPCAALATLDAQRFRLLQRVRDLRAMDQEGRPIALSPERVKALVERLETQGDVKFTDARKVLGLPKDSRFNLEDIGEKALIGNRTNAKLAAKNVFGPARWFAMPEEQRQAVVADCLGIDEPEALARRGREAYGLDDERSRALSEVTLEEGTLRLSRRAIRKLLPHMEKGLGYAEARKLVYGEVPEPPPLDRLPPAPPLRNPIVERALAELRKVVNAIVARHGKPELVRIELARDLKHGRKRRKALHERNLERRAEREQAARWIQENTTIREPSPRDVDKYLLWQECRLVCPYTGKAINQEALFGPQPEFDIEHIIPLSRSLDDSFANRTLCAVDENRNRKRNRTPFEAYGDDRARYDEILERVRRFQGPLAREKLRRFQLTPDEVSAALDGFTDRQLNDTAYASRAAADYVGRLFGGRVDVAGRTRVQATSGQVTAFLRGEWGLNGILSAAVPGAPKSREDHRHHAIDAIVTALTGPSTIQALSKAAALAEERGGRRRFAGVLPPWIGFTEEVRDLTRRIVVSHRLDRKLSGALHDATLWSDEVPARDATGNLRNFRHLRVAVDELKDSEIGAIVDPAVRDAVRSARASGSDPSLAGPRGTRIPIKKVRIREVVGAVRIGGRDPARYAKPGNNHHMAIYRTADARGRERWVDEVVSLLEAATRLRTQGPKAVVRRERAPGETFLFSLQPSEMVEMDLDGERVVVKVASVSREQEALGGRVWLRRHCDARPKSEAKVLTSKTADKLREARARKVVVSVLGEILPARD